MAEVNALISAAQGYATAQTSAASSLVSAAQSAISSLDTTFSVVGPNAPDIPKPEISAEIPELEMPSLNLPTEPNGPSGFANLPDLNVGAAPSMSGSAPIFTDPARPSQLRQLQVSAPVINTDLQFPDLPSALENIDIVMPTITDREVPDAPVLTLPVFDAVKPNDDISPPTDMAEKFALSYRSMAPTMYAALEGQMDAMLTRYNPRFREQMERLEGKLAEAVDTGLMLSKEAEDAIYSRSKDKTNAEYRRTRDVAYSDAAKRGFTLPDGVLRSAVLMTRQNAADNNARAATDIAIKQAELAVDNIKFALTTSQQLRTVVMQAAISYHGSLVGLNGQALDYAKSVLTAMVQTYDTLIKAFAAKMEAYKAEAAVYEMRLKAVVALVDIYKAEIDAMIAQTQIDKAKLDAVRARTDTLNSLAGVYRSRIDAILGQAQVQKMKVELFGAQVQAYGEEARAKSAEWQGYSAAVQGQEARTRAYGEEVRAYGARVEAFRATVAAKEAQVRSITTYNEGLVKQYVASVEGYRASVDAQSKVVSAQLDVNKSKLISYQAKIGAQEAQARATMEYYKAKTFADTQQFNVALMAAVEYSKMKATQIEAVAKTAMSGASVYASLAGSAMSGMNTLVSASEQ